MSRGIIKITDNDVVHQHCRLQRCLQPKPFETRRIRQRNAVAQHIQEIAGNDISAGSCIKISSRDAVYVRANVAPAIIAPIMSWFEQVALSLDVQI